MTTEQERKMLEAAAKACGAHAIIGATDDGVFAQWSPILRGARLWNPLTNPGDTAEMCAKLNIDWLNKRDWVLCRTTTSHGYVVKTDAQKIENHDNSRLKAWMYAATMVAAKIGGYTE